MIDIEKGLSAAGGFRKSISSPVIAEAEDEGSDEGRPPVKQPEDEKPRDDAAEKRAERAKKYDAGWYNFSVTVPPGCAQFLKKAYEKYREAHPDAFDL